MKQSQRVLVIIPAYNEAENIVHVVKHMMDTAPQYDYLVINDGSTDDTCDLCRRENFHYLDLAINMGIGGAVQAGYVYARKYDYDIAVQVDGDGQHDIAYLEKLLEPITSGEADVVLGDTQNGNQYSERIDLACYRQAHYGCDQRLPGGEQNVHQNIQQRLSDGLPRAGGYRCRDYASWKSEGSAGADAGQGRRNKFHYVQKIHLLYD